MGKRRVIKPPDERRQELMKAARELFIKQGYEPTTMNQIAERAGVAQGTFYIYFRSKQDVLVAIARELADALAGVVESLAERTDLPVPTVLRQVLTDCLTVVCQESRLVEALYLQANYSLPAQLVDQLAPRLLPVVTAIIERGVREGSLKVTHPRVAANLLWTVGYRVFEMGAQLQLQHEKGEPASPDSPSFAEVQAAFWEFVSQGLGVGTRQ